MAGTSVVAVLLFLQVCSSVNKSGHGTSERLQYRIMVKMMFIERKCENKNGAGEVKTRIRFLHHANLLFLFNAFQLQLQ
jgi:hypothetical protein